VGYKPQPWQLVLLIALICGVSLGGVVWYHSRAVTPAAMLKRMPAENTWVLWIDFIALRRAGILDLLAGAKASEDPEYQAFVRRTRFDYMQDLDTAMAAFAPTGNFFLVKGRFDWKSLRSYVESMDGNCLNSLCRVSGSGPDRRISFLPLRPDVMALAASPDDYAVVGLTHARSGPDPVVPDAPVWLAAPGSVLKSALFPDTFRLFTRSMENAVSVTLAFVPQSDRLAARLDVRCRNERDARQAASELASAIQLVRNLREQQLEAPGPADPAKVLAAGTIRGEGQHVYGDWPIERAFVQSLLGTQ